MHAALRVAIGSAALLLMTTSSRLAWAECGDQCTIELEVFQVEPPAPACVDIEAFEQDCDCGVWFRVLNTCDEDLVASDFAFSRCASSGAAECTVVTRGERASIFTELGEVGVRDFSYTLQSPEGEHRVSIRTNVHGFEESGCSTSRHGSSDFGSLSAGVALLTAMVHRRLRRRH